MPFEVFSPRVTSGQVDMIIALTTELTDVIEWHAIGLGSSPLAQRIQQRCISKGPGEMSWKSVREFSDRETSIIVRRECYRDRQPRVHLRKRIDTGGFRA